jgi:predicted RNase H-like nuclease
MKFIGVDGCKIGWFFVGLNGNGGWDIGVVPRISKLSEAIKASELTLVDIPIGLRERESQERLCDLSARKVLGKRRSSVFPAPCRLAINCDTYEEGSKVNYKYTGRKLAKQSWAIAAKIKEVDELLQDEDMKGKVREIHPEICFWALNKRREMEHSKKRPEGIKQRQTVLSKYCQLTDEIINRALEKYLRKDVAKDDIIDGLVGAVTATFSDILVTLPKEPEIDAKGLAMEMVYARL